VVVNRDLDAAVAVVAGVLHAARCTIPRQPGLPGFVAALL